MVGCVLSFLVLSWSMEVIDASVGDAYPRYRGCITQCQETGCVGQRCFPNCKFFF
ncbi:hypothetical protein AAZX31_02G141800 [Glycine max]|nr:hypothetical protein GLYMA_02G148351v4 [Glycine max]KAH1060397.1 hypothetical protein GYH30_004058 [Glycine max]